MASNTKLDKNRRHQQEAVKGALTTLRKHPRCQLHMAPGSGKTIVSLLIHEKRKSRATLFCAPTIHLVYQSLMSWAHFRSTRYSVLVVCSERPSRADIEELDDLRARNFSVSTHPDTIDEFLRTPGKKVIFSTYKSYIKVATAAQNGFTFDLGIFDEAHHVSGHIEKDATNTLKDEVIPIKKRVFLTATPRFATRRRLGDDSWYGMEYVEHFGRVAYTLPFRKAVDDKILTDYKLAITEVDRADLQHFDINTTLEEKVALIATVQAVVNLKLKKGLTFHSSMQKASHFSEKLRQAFEIMGHKNYAHIATLNHTHGVEHRSNVLRTLEESKNTAIITNVRVLG